MEQASKPIGSFSLVRVLLVIIPLLIIAVIAFQIVIAGMPPAYNPNMSNLLGLGQPTVNTLGPQYTDADGDLVADPPADPAQQVDPEVLKFSYIATSQPQRYEQVFADFVAHLSQVTGKPAEYVLYEKPEDQLRALKSGELHVTGFSTGAVPIAVDACGFVPVRMLGRADGQSGYRMQLIVPAASEVKSSAELRGKTIALTDPSSNSGFKAPVVILTSDLGLEPDRDFQVVYTYGHEASILGTAKGQYEVAAVASDMISRVAGRGEVAADQLRVIFSSELFPTAGLGYAHNLKPELAAKIVEAFDTFGFAGTSLEAEFAPSGVTKFVPASFKKDWALIRRIDNAVGFRHEVE